jgi:hypothetical protein
MGAFDPPTQNLIDIQRHPADKDAGAAFPLAVPPQSPVAAKNTRRWLYGILVFLAPSLFVFLGILRYTHPCFLLENYYDKDRPKRSLSLW